MTNRQYSALFALHAGLFGGLWLGSVSFGLFVLSALITFTAMHTDNQ